MFYISGVQEYFAKTAHCRTPVGRSLVKHKWWRLPPQPQHSLTATGARLSRLAVQLIIIMLILFIHISSAAGFQLNIAPFCITMYPSYLISPHQRFHHHKVKLYTPGWALMYCLKYCNTREERGPHIGNRNTPPGSSNTAQARVISRVSALIICLLYLQN